MERSLTQILRDTSFRVPVDRRAFLATPFIFLFNRGIEPHLQQMQNASIYNSTCHRFHEFDMWNRVVIPGQVCVHDISVAADKQPVYFAHGAVRIPILPVGILF